MILSYKNDKIARAKAAMCLQLPLTGSLVAEGSDAFMVKDHGVSVHGDFVEFGGDGAYLEVVGLDDRILAADDFAFCVDIWTDSHTTDLVGDILSKFDCDTRRGFTLGLRHHAGAVTSQTNYRNLSFEIDAATSPSFRDFGCVGTAETVWSLAVHEKELYAGTYEAGQHESGRVYRYLGSQRWECLGELDGSNNASALAVYDGHLYVATQNHDAHGSLLKPSLNDRPGGNVFRLETDGTWTHCGKVCEADNLFGLAVFDGHLYTWPMYAKGLYRYEGGQQWRRMPAPDSRLLALGPFRNSLFATANRLALLDPNATHAGPDGDPAVQEVVGRDGVYRMDEAGQWRGCGNQLEETQIYSMCVYRGEMYVGTWPSGKVFRYLGDQAWHDCGRLGDEDEIMGMAVYNGKLYAGGLPSASIYRYDDDGRWESIGSVDDTPDVPLRRAVNMTIYRGEMCVGTLPSGHVKSIRVGQAATDGSTFAPGWRHIAAVRRGGQISLFVDGRIVALSPGNGRALDISNNCPLAVGFGGQDYFRGRMRNLQLYRRSLDASEVLMLAKSGAK